MQILVLEDIPETRDWLIRILAKAFGADLTIEAAATRAEPTESKAPSNTPAAITRMRLSIFGTVANSSTL